MNFFAAKIGLKDNVLRSTNAKTKAINIHFKDIVVDTLSRIRKAIALI